MPTIHLVPGDPAPWTTSYLVLANGEATGFTVWRNEGEPLPVMTAPVQGPLSFVPVETTGIDWA